MSTKHSKKRNSGLMYEFLTRRISRCLVEGDNPGMTAALKAIKRHFKRGSTLLSEFRIANALYVTRVTSESVAASIMSEARSAARKQDRASLDKEKSSLVLTVNRLGDGVMEQHVDDYRVRAMIQTLLNSWRSNEPNLTELARHEDELVKWLMRPEPSVQATSFDGTAPGESGLLMRIMMSKLNERYSGTLNESQRSLVRDHVWSLSNDDRSRIVKKLENARSSLVNAIDGFTGNDHVTKQLTEVREKLLAEDFSDTDDAQIVRFLQYVKLDEELRTQDGSS